MPYITEFDPWKNRGCTCPPKYTLNPYTGCAHRCVYCYITSYIPEPFKLRYKRNLVRTVAKEVKKMDRDKYISLSNSSDPYPPVESENCITRNILKIFRENRFPVLIITKSDIVARDVDILSEMDAVVTLTITTVNDEIAKLLEPGAPPPSRRLKAIERLSEKVPCAVRIDPIIPFINENVEEVVKEVAPFVRQCIFSTLKLRRDAFERIIGAFPGLSEKLYRLYFKELKKIGNSYYLPHELRKQIIQNAREITRKYTLAFSSCREFMQEVNECACDGSSWFKNRGAK
ncbi:MAG: SPL family radical SAM protein [Thermoplasmata archaeon]